MITLEQIRALDRKVEDAVSMIRTLTQEKRALHEKLESYRERIDELEKLVNRFKEDQGKIEEGIEGAIRKLDSLGEGQDETSAPSSPAPAADAPAAEPEGQAEQPVPPTPSQESSSDDGRQDPLGDAEPDSGEEPTVAELDIF